MHAAHVNRSEMQCKYDRSVHGKFQLLGCQDNNSQLYYIIANDIPPPQKLSSSNKEIHEQLHCSRRFPNWVYNCMIIGNQADNPRILHASQNI